MIYLANTITPNGGTTFLIRMAKEHSKRGNKVKIIVMSDTNSDKHLSDFNEIADVFFMKNLYSKILGFSIFSNLALFLGRINKDKVNSLIKDEHSIHVMGIFGYILAKRFQEINPSINISVGIYHQNEFLYRSVKGFFNKWVYNEISNIKSKNIVFFNELTRTAYTNHFKNSFEDSKILPIGITLPKIDKESYKYEKGLIISVGNLVGFKTYNKHIIKILPKLLINYPYVKYHIYGAGEELNFLEKLVVSHKLEEVVSFKGLLDYKNYNEIVSKAHVFVGNGTALLESASLGVPSISGIESCEDSISYGFVSDIKGYDYNEYIEGKKSYSYLDLLSSLFESGEEGRRSLSVKCKENVKKFDIENTFQGFKLLESNTESNNNLISNFELFKLFLSFLWIVFLDFTKLDTRFRFRRNQGSSII
jgi:glycosyltransferase involved in cell wall biosynthesis